MCIEMHGVWPWETDEWENFQNKVTQQINSIVEMDTIISSVLIKYIKPRQITSLFEIYKETHNAISCERLLTHIIPCMQMLLKNAVKTFKNTPMHLLVSGSASVRCFSRIQVATIMSCIWFGAFDYDYVHENLQLDNFSEPSFVGIFSNANVFALACILDYFDMVCDRCSVENFIFGQIFIKRSILKKRPNWSKLHSPLSKIAIGEGGIDGSPAKLLSVFSQEFICKTNFKQGLTSEETSILLRPETYVATVLCERMCDNESITVVGAEMLSTYSGFGSSTRYAGKFVDPTPVRLKEGKCVLQSAVVFMDAGRRGSRTSQFVSDFVRDLNKATCAFGSIASESVACGNWHYLHTGNNMQIKFIQQLLAASANDKTFIYHPQGLDFERSLSKFVEWLQESNCTCSFLYNQYTRLVKSKYKGPNCNMSEMNVFELLVAEST